MASEDRRRNPCREHRLSHGEIEMNRPERTSLQLRDKHQLGEKKGATPTGKRESKTKLLVRSAHRVPLDTCSSFCCPRQGSSKHSLAVDIDVEENDSLFSLLKTTITLNHSFRFSPMRFQTGCGTELVIVVGEWIVGDLLSALPTAT